MMENEEKVLVNLKRVPLASERREIRNRILKVFLVIFLCLCALFGGIWIGRRTSVSKEATIVSGSSAYDEIREIMDRYWLYGDRYENLSKELENKALYGMTAFDFDPYTSYMSEEEMNSFSDSINRTYVGIGVEYSYVNDSALIVKVFKFSPAEKAGLKAGDVIVEVDGNSLAGLETGDIRKLVLGEEGTTVRLTVLIDGELREVDVVRGVIDSTVFAYTENDYIIMELDSFGETTASEVERYLKEYSDYKKIIIDLRSDSGGYQSAVRDISGLFIGPDEVYLRQKGANGVEMADKTPAHGRKYDNLEKIVILTSGNTASAAEVLTIALKERCNAIVVGETTYGKGVIQTNRVLSNGGVLKLTSYYWYSPDGKSIDLEGIQPDREVLMPDIYYEYYYDMKEGESYEFDSISDPVRISEMALSFLDYDIRRTDGYFDESFLKALRQFKDDHDLGDDDLLDRFTYSAIVSQARSRLADPEYDTQLIAAKEIMNED